MVQYTVAFIDLDHYLEMWTMIMGKKNEKGELHVFPNWMSSKTPTC